MFAYDAKFTVSWQFSDPTADASFLVWRVPTGVAKIEILEAWVATDTALSAGTANGHPVSLLNGGTAGTATATLAGAVGTALSGTYSAWVANTPREFTISEGTMTEGQYLVVKFDESGTVAPLNLYGQITYIQGVGA